MKTILALLAALLAPALVQAQEHQTPVSQAPKSEGSTVIVTAAPAARSNGTATRPSLLEVAARIRKIVEAHEQAMAAEKHAPVKTTAVKATDERKNLTLPLRGDPCGPHREPGWCGGSRSSGRPNCGNRVRRRQRLAADNSGNRNGFSEIALPLEFCG